MTGGVSGKVKRLRQLSTESPLVFTSLVASDVISAVVDMADTYDFFRWQSQIREARL